MFQLPDNCRVICSNRIMTGQQRERERRREGEADQAKPLKPFAAQAQRSLINYEHRAGVGGGGGGGGAAGARATLWPR